MKTYTMESALENFDELIAEAQQGLTVYVIGGDGHEYELILKRMPVNKPRKPGSAKGKIIITDEFYEPLPEFKPYTE